VADRRLARLVAAVVVVACTLGFSMASVPAEQTEAAWIDHEIGTAGLSTATLPPVPNLKCPTDGNTLTWTTPPLPYAGAVLAGYDVTWTNTATNTVVSTSSPAANATSVTLPAAVLVLLSSYRASITARYQHWITPPASRTIHVVAIIGGIKIFGCE